MANLSKTQRETWTLAVIADYQPVSIREIATVCKSGYSTTARTVHDLAKRRLIQRCAKPRWPMHWKTN